MENTKIKITRIKNNEDYVAKIVFTPNGGETKTFLVNSTDRWEIQEHVERNFTPFGVTHIFFLKEEGQKK